MTLEWLGQRVLIWGGVHYGRVSLCHVRVPINQELCDQEETLIIQFRDAVTRAGLQVDGPTEYELVEAVVAYLVCYCEYKSAREARAVTIERAIELQPRAGHVIDSLGWVRYQEGKYSEAVELLERAARLSAPDPIIHNHLGDAYQQAGEVDKAIEHWQSSIELDSPRKKQLQRKIRAAEKSARY